MSPGLAVSVPMGTLFTQVSISKLSRLYVTIILVFLSSCCTARANKKDRKFDQDHKIQVSSSQAVMAINGERQGMISDCIKNSIILIKKFELCISS